VNAVRWAVSPLDGQCHAFDRQQADGATERGRAEAVCGHTIPGRLIVADAPSGALCMRCVVVIGSQLPNPGPGAM